MPARCQRLLTLERGSHYPEFDALGQGQHWPDVYLDGYFSLPAFEFQALAELLLFCRSLQNEPQVKINQLRLGCHRCGSPTRPKGG